MKKVKLTESNLNDLIDQAKKDWQKLGHPLEDMDKNLTPAQQVGLAYFLASLSVLNQMLPDEKISDKVIIAFNELDIEVL